MDLPVIKPIKGQPHAVCTSISVDSINNDFLLWIAMLYILRDLGVNDLGQQTSRRTAFASRSNVDWRVVPRRAIFAPKLVEVWSYLDAENRMKQLIWKLLKQIQ